MCSLPEIINSVWVWPVTLPVLAFCIALACRTNLTRLVGRFLSIPESRLRPRKSENALRLGPAGAFSCCC